MSLRHVRKEDSYHDNASYFNDNHSIFLTYIVSRFLIVSTILVHCTARDFTTAIRSAEKLGPIGLIVFLLYFSLL